MRPNSPGTRIVPAYYDDPLTTARAHVSLDALAPPSRPAAATVQEADGQLTVRWSEPDANGSAISGYMVRHRPAPGLSRRSFDWTVEDAGAGPEYTIRNLTRGERYEIQVRAVNAAGGSPWSGSVSGVTDPPPPPPPPTPTPPDAGFAIDIGCSRDPCRVAAGREIAFSDTSSGTVTGRRWEFGDGRTSGRRTVSHAWPSPGFYTVTLTVTGGEKRSPRRHAPSWSWRAIRPAPAKRTRRRCACRTPATPSS